jgi:hypothetical protein
MEAAKRGERLEVQADEGFFLKFFAFFGIL